MDNQFTADRAQQLEIRWGSRTNVYKLVGAPDPSNDPSGPFELSVIDKDGNPSVFEPDRDNHRWLAQPAVPINDLGELKRSWETTPTLFRKFGDLASKDDGPHSLAPILAFANEHGWLGLPHYAPGPAGRGQPPAGNAEQHSSVQQWSKLCYEMDISVDGEPYWGESLSAWFMEIQNLSLAIRWRDAVKSRDHRAFLNSLHERLPNVYLKQFRQQNYWELIPQGRIPQFLVVQSQPVYSIDDKDQWRNAANAGLKRLINDKLRLHTSSVIQLDDATGEFTREATPHDLIGAMWIQLATEVSRNQDFVSCEHCRGLFLRNDPNDKSSRRKDARYCSPSCVEKVSRIRKQITIDRGASKPWEDIAREMSLPVARARALYREYVENQKRKTNRSKKK